MRQTVSGRNRNPGIAVIVGLASGVIAFLYMAKDGQPGDFLYWYTAAKAILAGQSPYDVIPASNPARFQTAFFYPLPTALVTIPFTLFPYPMAGGLFTGICSGLLAFGLLTQRGPWSLVTFLSPAFLISCLNGTWTIPVTAALLMPALSAFLVAKPNLAVPAFAYRPTLIAMAGGAGLLLLSFLIQPMWLAEWRSALDTMVGHPPPILTSAAILTPLVLRRWRRPDARLVFVSALVPQQAYMYDQLPLWAVAETRREFLTLTLLSSLVYLCWLYIDLHGIGSWRAMETIALSVHYLTVIVFVLSRPNRVDTV